MNARAMGWKFIFILLPSLANAAQLKISDRVDFVLLDVSVTNKAGEFVRNLDRAAFRVFDDGVERPIREFSASDLPAAIGLVVDNSGSMTTKRPEVITAGLAFVKESNSADQFFVVNFNDSVAPGLPPAVPFTNDLRLLRKSLYFGKPTGQTALYDAIAYSLKHLAESGYHRYTLIVVSDGRDNVSRTSFRELLAEVEASKATIYTVGLNDPNTNDLNPAVLRKLARVSGGESFEPNALSEVAPVFQQISQDIEHRYVIGYVPDELHDKRRIRTIKVTAREDGQKLKVHTRTTYSIGSEH